MHSDPGLLLLSAKGRILWTNDAAAALLGFPKEELIEMALPFTADASRTVAAGPIAVGFRAVCFEGAEQAEGTARFRTKEGAKISVHWILWSIAGADKAQALLSLREIADLGRAGNESHSSPDGSVIAIRRVEAALRNSEERFRRLVETANVVPWEATLGAERFTYVGPQAFLLLGHPLESWLEGGFWENVVHPDDQGWVKVVRGEALEKRENFECEYRMIRADGRVVRVREIVSVLSSEESGSVLGGFFFDVTQRREAEESLEESRHFIEQIASASPTISYLYDPTKDQCIYTNGRVADILGFSKEVLTEMHPLFIVSLAHPSEMETHRDYFVQLMESPEEQVLGREFRLRSAAGTWVWVYSRECVFKRDAMGRPEQIVGTLEDITVHRQTMEELQASEALFRKLAESARVIPFEFDPRSEKFTYIGPQAEAILGERLQHGLTRDAWRSMLHPDDIYEGTRFAAKETPGLSADYQTEFRIRGADGRVIWLRQIVHRSSDEYNREQIRGFLFDVTETKTIEEEFEQSRTKVRELAARSHQAREEERRSIARELHDELGQALTLLKLDLSWLEGSVSKAVAGAALVECSSKVEEMQQRVDGTLETLRGVLSELRPPLLDELGLPDAVEWHAMKFARSAALRCDLQIEEIKEVPIEVSLAIFRIFQEVTTNIAKHARASRLRVTLALRGPYLALEVADNGRGMVDGDREKPGHFGLLGMRERAWAFGGQVWVDSVPGKGTTVRVEIPVDGAARLNRERTSLPEVAEAEVS